MSDRMSQVLTVIGLVVVVACCAVTLVAMRTTGWPQVGVMVACLGVIITILGLYNRRYR